MSSKENNLSLNWIPKFLRCFTQINLTAYAYSDLSTQVERERLCTLLSFSASLSVHRLTVNLFSRKIPGLNVYAEMQNEKEQEMKSPANPTEASAGSQRDLVHSLEILDTEFSSRPIGEDAPSSSASESACDSPCHQLLSRHCMSHHTHPVPFCFCSSEVKRSWPWRDERELERSSVITLCSSSSVLLRSWTTRDLRLVTATKEHNGLNWPPSNKSCHFHVSMIRSAFIVPVKTSMPSVVHSV